MKFLYFNILCIFAHMQRENLSDIKYVYVNVHVYVSCDILIIINILGFSGIKCRFVFFLISYLRALTFIYLLYLFFIATFLLSIVNL